MVVSITYPIHIWKRSRLIKWRPIALGLLVVIATTIEAKFLRRFGQPRRHSRPRLMRMHRDNYSLQDQSQLSPWKQEITDGVLDSSVQYVKGAATSSTPSTILRNKDARMSHALSASGGASVVENLQEASEGQHQQQKATMVPTVTVVPTTIATSTTARQHAMKRIKTIADTIKEFIETSLAVIAPIVLAVCGIRRQDASSIKLMSFGGVYFWSLLGSSVGFYLFLYFISVGYALGVGLPILVTFVAYLRYCQQQSMVTVLHASLVLVWSVRLVTFLLYREHLNWPALHAKVVRVNKEQRVGRLSKILCWMVYTFLYVCMLSPCWLRMEEESRGGGMLKRGCRFGIGLQVVGLLVETVADYQKSHFKLNNRLSWCREGLWKYSTHPNYAGEWLFWLGTYIAGGTSRNTKERLLQIVGLGFISIVLYGAINALSNKQATKYGDAYQAFRSSHTIFGPKIFRRGQTTLSKLLVESNESRLKAVEQHEQQGSIESGVKKELLANSA